MIALLPPRSCSMCARPRTVIRPRPERYASRMPLRPTMEPAGREVGSLDVLREALDVDHRVVDHRHDPADDLGEVVRWNVRRHADRDARRAVDEEVREPRREDRRLTPGFVVVRDEVDGVGVDVPEHLRRNSREAALRVPHGACRIAVDGAEVPLALDQRIPHRERLRETDERVVDRRVAVRVVVPHDIAHDARGLPGRPVRLKTRLVHCVEDAPVNRLEPVPDVREGPTDDHAHRVIEEARCEPPGRARASRLGPCRVARSARTSGSTHPGS